MTGQSSSVEQRSSPAAAVPVDDVLLKGFNFPNVVIPDSSLFIAPGAVTGFVVGIAQTRILNIPDRRRWIVASTAAATALVVGAGLGGRLNIVNSTVDGLLVGSVAYGMVSGLAVPGLCRAKADRTQAQSSLADVGHQNLTRDEPNLSNDP